MSTTPLPAYLQPEPRTKQRHHRDAHETARGYGKVIYRKLVLECVRCAAAIVGVSVVYLVSLPDEKVITNYRRYGFDRLPDAFEENAKFPVPPIARN